ncbi:MAG: ACT domain-containing protein [Clostridia bacterium]|nr:ACT domain-containing protein [Clostridia bacterium]
MDMPQSTQSNYLIVDRRILPDYYGKVVEACEMLRSGHVKDVSEAVRIVGISRSTYYKYKDYVFAPGEDTLCKKAVISVMLSHETGVLSELLSLLSRVGANILTITQTLPVHEQANVVITLDMTHMRIAMDALLEAVAALRGASNVHLIAIE